MTYNITEKIYVIITCGMLLFLLSKVIASANDSKNAILTYSKDTKFINTKNQTKSGISQSHCLWECINLPDCHSACFNIEEKRCFLNYEVDESYKQTSIMSQQGWLYYQQYQVCREKFVFEREEETTLSTIMEVKFPLQTKSWSLSFDLDIREKNSRWRRVIQVQDEDISHRNQIGYRTPNINVKPDADSLEITSSLNGQANAGYSSSGLGVNVFTSIEVKQIFGGVDKYYRVISINGRTMHTIENTDARVFQNMVIRIGHPLFVKSTIRNIHYRNICDHELP